MKSIYVSRKVVNPESIAKWALDNNYKDIQDDLHVTVAYSKKPVDETKIELDDNNITVPLSGRALDHFGDFNVLLIQSDELQDRWDYFVNQGCSWDYPNYSPHISFSKDEELSTTYPFLGEIILGPEIMEDLHDDDE